jgi:hypothetical protein
LTIGPAFYSAAIYLSISRIITIFGNGLCWFKPRTVTLAFIGFDVVSLILQSAGGAIASMADTQKDTDMGVNIMIAGLAAQVAATSAFAGVCIQLAIAIRRHPERLDYQYAQFRKTLKFKLFLSGKLIQSILTLQLLTDIYSDWHFRVCYPRSMHFPLCRAS